MTVRALVSIAALASAAACATTSTTSASASARAHESSAGGAAAQPAGDAQPAQPAEGPRQAQQPAQPAQPQQPAQPARAFPPPPQYTDLQSLLRDSRRGVQCFAGGVTSVSLADAYADGDFDGDGRPDRVFHLPECLAVAVQGETHWEVPVLVSRSVPRGYNSVTLHAVQRDGATLVEVRYLRDSPRARDVARFRYANGTLTQVP